jgi:hypothetical protein
MVAMIVNGTKLQLLLQLDDMALFAEERKPEQLPALAICGQNSHLAWGGF